MIARKGEYFSLYFHTFSCLDSDMILVRNNIRRIFIPLQPKRTIRSSLEYALFFKILRFVQGTRGFGLVQLMNNTLLEMF